MKALITGASSGLGRDFAYKLANDGYDLVLVARSKDKLNDIKNDIKTNVEVEVLDLSDKNNALKLYKKYSNQIDLLINNAGFGDCGFFTNTDLDNELNMIDLNVVTCHILTKLFLKEFLKKDSGQILNVASSAAFEPGPLMATYYATKAYVLHLTESINEELRRKKSNVFICALCPGPVSTNFNKVAGVSFNLESLESYDVAKYAVKQMFKKKVVIIPGFKIKMGVFALRLLPRSLVRKIAYKIQKNKEN